MELSIVQTGFTEASYIHTSGFSGNAILKDTAKVRRETSRFSGHSPFFYCDFQSILGN